MSGSVASHWLLIASLACVLVPTYVDLAQGLWFSEEQGHGPIVLAVTIWLAKQRLPLLASMPDRPNRVLGWPMLLCGLVAYAIGRSQAISTVEVGSHLPILLGLLLLTKGTPGVSVMKFPAFFMLFLIPLPGVFVQALTTPLKSAVSIVAEHVLFLLGYPIARSGVILHVGPYQLLVADACAGLSSMFTLEALGLLYLNLVGHTSLMRNAILAAITVPVAFAANVVRVMALVVVTYHWGDEVGQGFLHGLAGLVLFLVALILLFAFDALLGAVLVFKHKLQGRQ